jgi:alcohol dehydrogenase (cytochrome c)
MSASVHAPVHPLILAAVAIGLAGGGSTAIAAEPAAGGYTVAQAQAGQNDYAINCAACHGATLGGAAGPALTGNAFMTSWGPKTTQELYEYLSKSMPAGNPGALGASTYAGLTAFLLQANGAKAGSEPFATGASAMIASVANGQAPEGLLSAVPSRQRPPAPQPEHWGLTVEGHIQHYVPVTDQILTHPSDGEWLMYRRTYQGWSYSPLKEINARNVGTLQLKWAWAMNEGGASEVTPIVHDGIIFLSNTQNTVQALDARTGELLWENRIGPASTVAYGGTRSLGLYQDKVYVATYDAKLHALDARTGKIVWEAVIDAPPKGETGGLMIIHGKVLVGLMGCDNYSTTNCFISAYDATTGARDWTFHTTALEGEPGGDTWNGLPNLLRGGGDTWIAGTYDPELNTTYWGVAQTKPWMRASRKSGNAATLYSSSTLALDPDTGKLKWFFQHAPGESLDLDEVFERVLIDHGAQKTVMTIGKPGILWKLDRVTGKFLDAKQTLFQNVFSSLDPQTGAVSYRQDILDQKTGEWIASCPGPEGGHDWHATSYNQPTDLLIIPESQSCVLMQGHEVEMKLGGGGTAASQQFYFMPGTHQNMGRLLAYRTSDMKRVWSIQQRAPFLTAVLSTAGGVAFVGDFDRYFKAVDVRTGKILWQTRLGNGVQGHPVSFSLDGRQYIAVTTGLGGGSPIQKPSALLTEVHRPATGQQLYVFALPEGR